MVRRFLILLLPLFLLIACSDQTPILPQQEDIEVAAAPSFFSYGTDQNAVRIWVSRGDAVYNNGIYYGFYHVSVETIKPYVILDISSDINPDIKFYTKIKLNPREGLKEYNLKEIQSVMTNHEGEAYFLIPYESKISDYFVYAKVPEWKIGKPYAYLEISSEATENPSDIEAMVDTPVSENMSGTLSCSGQSCHVVQRSDGWHVISTILETGETFDDGSWILNASQYASWIANFEKRQRQEN